MKLVKSFKHHTVHALRKTGAVKVKQAAARGKKYSIPPSVAKKNEVMAQPSIDLRAGGGGNDATALGLGLGLGLGVPVVGGVAGYAAYAALHRMFTSPRYKTLCGNYYSNFVRSGAWSS